MESQRNGLKQIAGCELVVLFEVIEQCLFVAKVEVMSEVVVHSLVLTVHLLQV